MGLPCFLLPGTFFSTNAFRFQNLDMVRDLVIGNT